MAEPGLTPEEFAKELIKAVRKVPGRTVKVVRRNAVDVKRQARRNVKQTAPVHQAHAQNAINWDVDAEGVLVVAEIGYDKSIGGGPLGNLLEFGGGGDHSPPHRDLSRALDGQVALFMDDLGAMGEALLAGAEMDAYARRSAFDGDLG